MTRLALLTIAAVALLAMLARRRVEVEPDTYDEYVPMTAWTWPDDRYLHSVTFRMTQGGSR